MSESELIKALDEYTVNYVERVKIRNNNDVKVRRTKVSYDDYWKEYMSTVTINWISHPERKVRYLHFAVDETVKNKENLKIEDLDFQGVEVQGKNNINISVSLK